MNKNQRRGRVPRRNDSLNRFKHGIRGLNVQGSLPSPKHSTKEKSVTNRCFSSKERVVFNRCCFISPEKQDFGQSCDTIDVKPKEFKEKGQATHQVYVDQFKTLLNNQYDSESATSENFNIQNDKNVSCCTSAIGAKSRLLDAHLYSDAPPTRLVESAQTQWQKVDSSEEVDKLLTNSEVSGLYKDSKNNIFICEAPTIKVIAEKFSKFKRNNLEVRRLEEKVVCVEYDVFDKSTKSSVLKPMQKMRAFFTIRPAVHTDAEKRGDKQEPRALPKLPSNIKNKFELSDDDLKKLTQKEIEFIDSKLEDNKSYLEDLRRILKRTQVINAKKNKTSLDLPSLYEMAKRDRPLLNCDFSQSNLLSKAELQEVKDLILQRCTSNVHGFRRKKIERKENESGMDMNVISDSIVAELFRDDAVLRA